MNAFQKIVPILLVILFPLSAVVQAQDTAPAPLEIREVNAGQFPEVAVHFDAAADVSEDQLALTENGQPVEIQSLSVANEQGPVTFAIVIDQSLYAVSRYRQDYNAAILRHYFEILAADYFRDGVDTALILAGRRDAGTESQQRVITILEPTASQSEFTAAVAGLDLGLQATISNLSMIHPMESSVLVEAAIDELETQPNPVIVYLSSHIHAPRESGANPALAAARRLADIAKARGVRIYPLQANGVTDSDALRQPLTTLAAETGGGYLRLEEHDDTETVRRLFDGIRVSEETYTLSFRSSIGSEEARNLALTLSQAPEAPAEVTYEVVLADPTVHIDSEATLVEEQEEFYALTISAGVVWPDDYARAIEVVTVNGAAPTDWTIEDNQLIIQLEVTKDGSSSHFIELEVVDELGRSATAEDVITLPMPEPVPTPTPEPTDDEGPVLWHYLALLALIPAGIVAFVTLSRTNRLSVLTQKANRSPRRAHTEIAGNQNQEALALLHVVAAAEHLTDEIIEIVNDLTTLGRDPQTSDIQLYDLDERSTVSARHCTIQHDQGTFWITDNNSSNGTSVNGRRLASDDPHPLQSGDEIVLGQKARRGARLRFEVLEDAVRRHSVTETGDSASSVENQRSGITTQVGDEDLPRPSNPLPTPDDASDGSWLTKLE